MLNSSATCPDIVFYGTGKWDRRDHLLRTTTNDVHDKAKNDWTVNQTHAVEQLHILMPSALILFHMTMECGERAIAELNIRLEKSLHSCCADYAIAMRRHINKPLKVEGCRTSGNQCCRFSDCRDERERCHTHRGQSGAPQCHMQTTCTPASGHSWGPGTTLEVDSVLSALCPA